MKRRVVYVVEAAGAARELFFTRERAEMVRQSHYRLGGKVVAYVPREREKAAGGTKLERDLVTAWKGVRSWHGGRFGRAWVADLFEQAPTLVRLLDALVKREAGGRKKRAKKKARRRR